MDQLPEPARPVSGANEDELMTIPTSGPARAGDTSGSAGGSHSPQAGSGSSPQMGGTATTAQPQQAAGLGQQQAGTRPPVQFTDWASI